MVSSVASPSRFRRSLARTGPLGVALILGALLVVSSGLSYRDARTGAGLVAERQQHRLHALREIASSAAEPPLGYGAPAMRAVEQALHRVAPTAATVLLLGESGVGKEIDRTRLD
jgi:transcriptional regulator with GAF, ATPase, and Fis domain